MKVLFTPIEKGNPYQKLLTNSVKRYNIEIVVSNVFPNYHWLWNNRGAIPIIHLHWPSRLYRMARLTAIRAILLLSRICLARFLGYRLVWTIHNILPHESETPFFDKFFRFLLVRYCDGIIGHCEHALIEVQKRFGRAKKTIVIPHGNYNSYYPDKPKRAYARQRLGLPEKDFVLLMFGLLREYKGTVELIEALCKIKQKVILIVAGKGSIAQSIQRKAVKNNIDLRLYCYYIPDEDVPVFFAAADAMVAPYKTILTSGAIILGISMGLPIVAPTSGCIPELLDHDTGILYNPSDSDGLTCALTYLLENKFSNMEASIKKKSSELGWTNIGKITANYYRQISKDG